MDPTQNPTSSEPPINNPSTSNDEVTQDNQILTDAKYAELDVEWVVNQKPPQEYHTQVECTPFHEQPVNELPQKINDEIRTSCPTSLPQLSGARKRTPRRIHLDKSFIGLEGKLPKQTIDLHCSKIVN